MDLAARPESDESNGPGSQSPVLSTTGSRVLFVSGRHLVGDAIRVALESRGLERLSSLSSSSGGPAARGICFSTLFVNLADLMVNLSVCHTSCHTSHPRT